MLDEILDLVHDTFWLLSSVTGIFSVYVLTALVVMLVYGLFSSLLRLRNRPRNDFNTRKTITFGDSSAVSANRFASVFGVLTIFAAWGIATGSALFPDLLLRPYVGTTKFEYTAKNAYGQTDTGTVHIQVYGGKTKPEKIGISDRPTAGGFAVDDAVQIKVRRSGMLRPQKNDIGGKDAQYSITHLEGQPVTPGDGAAIEFLGGSVVLTKKGSLSIRAYPGQTMEALYLPPPEGVWKTFLELNKLGYQGTGLYENLFWSLMRVLIGFSLGCIFGIPLGFAMGLNGWLRGWFDPIVEFMRPIPPLALIPLVIIWFGIWEKGKIFLLFLAALWIMTIAARAGVSGMNISKVHAAYSLGASKVQLLLRVMLPNSLPELFTGARVAMGVCWGTVVAAELVAAEKGAGKMIIAASKFQLTDIVIVGIIIIGIVGYGIDILMRKAEDYLIPWKGRS